MDVTALALQGLEQTAVQAETSARRISQAGAAVASGGGDVVDLSAEMVALMQARNLNGALVSVIKTASEMDSHILNILG